MCNMKCLAKISVQSWCLEICLLSSIFVRHCDRGGTTQLLMFGFLSSNTGRLYGFPLVAEAVLQPRLKAGHCKSLKATVEEVEQIKTVGGSEAS